MPTHIRWGVARDLPKILKIEAASFTSAWTEDDFNAALRKKNCIAMVAEEGDDILAYTVYELHDRHITLLNFAVAPDIRRQGIGAALMDKLKYKVISHRRSAMRLTCRDSNLTAQLFFRSQSLRAIAVKPDYYDDEGGIRFEWSPGAAECARHGFPLTIGVGDESYPMNGV